MELAEPRIGSPYQRSLAGIHDAVFLFKPRPEATREWADSGCRTAGIGCLDCKAKLAEHMLEKLAQIHARRPELEKRPDTVWDVLIEGSRRAREVAEATMQEVRSAMKIRYDRP